jgi:hypothetical protein
MALFYGSENNLLTVREFAVPPPHTSHLAAERATRKWLIKGQNDRSV